MKESKIFKFIQFFYNHKLFGVHKKCWARLVSNYLFKPFHDSYEDIPDCNMCEGDPWTYCGKECGCDRDKEIYCKAHEMNINNAGEVEI